MIHSFRHPGLKELYETGKSRRVPPKLVTRIMHRLDAIQAAKTMGFIYISPLTTARE